MRVLWVNPSFGVAGDMLLAALLDLGAGLRPVRSVLDQLGIGGWELEVEPETRRGLACSRVRVAVGGNDGHRPWSAIDSLLEQSSLPPGVSQGARRTFRLLAEAESRRHGIEIDQVHFHEVGAVDAIVDIVGCWAALAHLEVGEVHSAPVGLGAGIVATAHGTLPNPAPATLELLAGIPARGLDTDEETATPTGVALLATMVDRWGPFPPGRVGAAGYGAGSRDHPAYANVITAVLVESDRTVATEAVLIETTVDDVTPELLGYVMDRAIAAGADDAWLTPVVMKKSRPGHLISVLCPPGSVPAMTELLAAETGTLGVRSTPVGKQVLPRRFEQVEVDGMVVRIKVGPHGAKPELDDLARVAAATGRPLQAVSDSARRAWARQTGEQVGSWS